MRPPYPRPRIETRVQGLVFHVGSFLWPETRAISIRDKLRVPRFHLALTANPVGAFCQGDGSVLLVMDRRGAAFDLHVTDVEAGRDLAGKGVVTKHCHAIIDGVTMTSEFTFCQ